MLLVHRSALVRKPFHQQIFDSCIGDLAAGYGSQVHPDDGVRIGTPFRVVGCVPGDHVAFPIGIQEAVPGHALAMPVHIVDVEPAAVRKRAVGAACKCEKRVVEAVGVPGPVVSIAEGESIGRSQDRSQRFAGSDKDITTGSTNDNQLVEQPTLVFSRAIGVLPGSPVVAIADTARARRLEPFAVAATGLRPIRTVEHVHTLGVGLQQLPDIRDGIRRLRLIDGWRHLIVVLDVHVQRQPDLTDIAQALCTAGALSGLRKYWEENSCQDRDNSDHHEQLDERKPHPVTEARHNLLLSPDRGWHVSWSAFHSYGGYPNYTDQRLADA